MGCATATVRIIVFVFNFVFALAGLALLIVGVLYKLDVSEATQAIPDALELAPTLLIIVGCIVFVISFFGCCGAVRESTCMLTTYAVILLVIFLLQVAVAVFAFLQIRDTDSLRTEFKNGMSEVFGKYSTDKIATEAVDTIQRNHECCGLDKPEDIRFLNGTYPNSCCRELVNEVCTDPFPRGCLNVVYEFAVRAVKIIGIVAISIAGVEIIGAIAALCLSSSIRNQYRRGAYA